MSTTGTPGIHAAIRSPGVSPCSPSNIRLTKAGETNGLAASWIRTSSQSSGKTDKPFRTESWRNAPPATTFQGSPREASLIRPVTRLCSSSMHASGNTKTSPSTRAHREKTSADSQYNGAPFQSKNCLASPPVAEANRFPCPAARRSVHAMTNLVYMLDVKKAPVKSAYAKTVTGASNRESDYKPGSVPLHPCGWYGDCHSSRSTVTCTLKQPTRKR